MKLSYPRLIYTKSNYFHDMDDHKFYRRFRLTKQTCLKVLTLIEDKLEAQKDISINISPMNQLLTTLYYYASCGHFSGINAPTTNKIILRVSESIASMIHSSSQYIKMPKTVAEIKKVQDDFYQVAGFPNIIGAMDCTHIKIPPPEKNPDFYKNRKSYYSIIVQVISNANQDILNIIARWPGSVHDSRIYEESRIRARMEMGEFPNSLLLGYNGYPLTDYFLTPVRDPTSRAENLYNEAHKKTLNLVDQLFRNWKRRFPVLAYGMRFKDLQTVFMIIVATAILENIAHSMHDLQPPPVPEHLDDVELEELIENGQIPRFFLRMKKNTPVKTRNDVIANHFENL